MAQQDKATLKQAFETGDAPDGSDFANLIDSQLNLQETTAQTINGPVAFAGGASFAAISAATVGGATGDFGEISATTATFSRVSANSIFGLGKAEMHAVAFGTAVFASLSTYAVLSNIVTSADAGVLSQFTHNGSGQLTYTGTLTKAFEVEVSFSCEAVTSLQRFRAAIAVNGSAVERTSINFKCTTAAGQSMGAGSFGGVILLTANSTVAIAAQALANVSDIVFTRVNMRVREA